MKTVSQRGNIDLLLQCNPNLHSVHSTSAAGWHFNSSSSVGHILAATGVTGVARLELTACWRVSCVLGWGPF